MNNGTDTDIRRGWTSASNASADRACPGRHLAQAGIPDIPSEEAESGKLIHAALADSGNLLKYKMSLAQREIFDACREVEKSVIGLFFEQPALSNGEGRFRAFREERFWTKFKLSGDNGREYEHSGVPDVVFRSGLKALVVDYKTGSGDVVESARNEQLRDLACLVRGKFVTVSEVGTVIIQPLVTHTPEICLYTSEDLDRATKEMFDRIVASNDPNSPRVPSEIACKFCRAKNKNCAEYQQWAGQITPPAMLSVLVVPMVNWTSEQRAVAANALQPAMEFLENLKEFLKQGLEHDPAFVPGWGLTPGAKREEINNPQAVFDRFIKVGGSVEHFMPAVKVLKSKLKEQLSALTGARGKPLDILIKGLTDGYVDFKQNAPSLKRLGDK